MLGLLTVGVLALAASDAADLPPAIAGAAPEVTLNEEFDGTALDTAIWNTHYLWGDAPVNNELQFYDASALEVSGGTLKITANRESVSGRAYKSGIITSANKFHQEFGYFEMRARVPKGRGLWPAFWLLPHLWAEGNTEIDIMEFLGGNPHSLYFSFHRPDEGGAIHTHRMRSSADLSNEFHRFGLYWAENILIWYVDGVERTRYEGPNVPHQSMHIIANLAVGGWPGEPNDKTEFPAVFEIDYIRVYSFANTSLIPDLPR